jgi:hypothetical protein
MKRDLKNKRNMRNKKKRTLKQRRKPKNLLLKRRREEWVLMVFQNSGGKTPKVFMLRTLPILRN